MYFLYFIIGSCFGSFLSLAAYRLPAGGSIWGPASHCDHCQQPLRWYELIPIFSILWQRFRCRSCQATLSPVMLLAELLGGLLIAYGFSGGRLSWLELVWLLWGLALALTDIFYYLVEPRILFGGTGLLWLWQLSQRGSFHTFSLLYCLVICLLFSLFFRGKSGFGDFLLLFSWGPWLPLVELLLLLIVACTAGILVFLTFRRYWQNRPLPFVPFLTFGLLVVFLL